MRASHFIHTATITRGTHTIAGRQKLFNETTVASGVACRIQPLVNTVNESVLGLGVAESWQGYFPPETDIKTRDIVEWTTSSPSTSFVAETVMLFRDRHDSARVIEVTLKKRET